jgi:hypothetical protein
LPQQAGNILEYEKDGLHIDDTFCEVLNQPVARVVGSGAMQAVCGETLARWTAHDQRAFTPIQTRCLQNHLRARLPNVSHQKPHIGMIGGVRRGGPGVELNCRPDAETGEFQPKSHASTSSEQVDCRQHIAALRFRFRMIAYPT